MSLTDRLRRAGADRLPHEPIDRKLRRLILDAHREGITQTRIAEVAGVSRQSVHEILRNEER